MLGNQVELWEAMLADHEAGRGDHADHDRGGAGRPGRPDRPWRRPARDLRRRRHRQVRPGARATTCGSASARPRAGPTCARPRTCEHRAVAHPGTAPDDPLLLYFTSGTTSQAQAGRAHPGLLPGRPPVHDVLARAAARRRAPEHLLTRLGQARLVAASSRRGSPRRPSSSTTTAASTPRHCSAQLRRSEITSFCAPPTVWRMLINADLASGPAALREVDRRRRAAQPRGHRAGPARLGADHPRRLRPDRDHRRRSATPRAQRSRPGSMGRPLPGVPVVLVDPATGRLVTGQARARSASICPAPAAADDRLPG